MRNDMAERAVSGTGDKEKKLAHSARRGLQGSNIQR